MSMVVVGMRVFVLVLMVTMVVLVVMIMRQVNLELDSFDRSFVATQNVHVILIQAQFLELVFKPMAIHAQIQQRSDEHIAADAAKDIEIQSFHAITVRLTLIR